MNRTKGKVVKRIKRAVLTVEAAVVVPIATIILALLIGYIFYMHETSRSQAAAFEAEFYGIQKAHEGTTVERVNERLEQREKEGSIGVGKYDYSVLDGSSHISVNITGSVLNEVFKDVFTSSRDASIRKIDPVSAKRRIWIGDYILKAGE